MFGESDELPSKYEEHALDPESFDAFVGEFRGKDACAFAREGDHLCLFSISSRQQRVRDSPGIAASLLLEELRVLPDLRAQPGREGTGISIREVARWMKVVEGGRSADE